MKRSLITLVKAQLPPRVRTLVKELVGFPVPIDSDYEANTQQALRYLLRPEDVAFDVGANEARPQSGQRGESHAE